MIWQDLVFAACSAVFLVSLVPSMRASAVPRMHSVPTALACAAQVVVYATLGLGAAATMSALIAACWCYIAVWRGPRPAKPVWVVFDVSSGDDPLSMRSVHTTRKGATDAIICSGGKPRLYVPFMLKS